LGGAGPSRQRNAPEIGAELRGTCLHEVQMPVRHDASRPLLADELQSRLRDLGGLPCPPQAGEQLRPERQELGPGLRPFAEEPIDTPEDLLRRAPPGERELEIPVAVQVRPVGRYPGRVRVRALAGSPADVLT